MNERQRLKEVAYAYVERDQRMQQAMQRGDVDAIDRATDRLKAMERDITILETSGSWRNVR